MLWSLTLISSAESKSSFTTTNKSNMINVIMIEARFRMYLNMWQISWYYE